ncbi:MAG: prenyltransferase [Desulfurococcales archaeon]|nr:prenyltransferase [Desulfurococcales archaeon]
MFKLLLIYIGVFISHLAVNVFNDYFDYKKGIDLLTPETPFSGGSKALVKKMISVKEALYYGVSLLITALSIGLYLVFTRGLLTIVFIIGGALILLLYTTVLTRYSLGELGIYLKGVLISLGSYYVVYQDIEFIAFIIGSFFGLVSLIILFVNSIPDRDVDKLFGRKTLVTTIDKHDLWIIYLMISIILFINFWLITFIYVSHMMILNMLFVALAFLTFILLLLNSLYLRNILFIEKFYSEFIKKMINFMATNIFICRILEISVIIILFINILLRD